MKSMRQFIIGGAVSIVICIGFFAWSTRDWSAIPENPSGWWARYI